MSADMGSDHEEKPLKKSKRKHRKQEEDADTMAVEETPKATDSTKKDKKKKDKKRKERSDEVENDGADAEPAAAASPEKKHKKHKSEDKKEKKHKQSKSSPSLPERPKPAAATTGKAAAAAAPKDREYPFFTQTFSQRVPIWPASFDEPLTKTAREYLDPMLNRYSPKFRGVLLEYKNVNLSHRPQRADPSDPPTDDTPVLLQSVECYAPPFAWLTADLHLFIPSRGAWMEGEINLQSEGHIGVVCFEKFNASISRRSLPKGWTWVDQPDEEDVVAEEEVVEEEEDPFAENAGEGDEAGEDEDGNTARDTHHQVRSSGHWVDENGDRVSGKVYFRIKNFSSGSTGDFTYLSLQGTMLDEEAERKAVAEERETEKARRARQNASGLLYPTMRLPEFSMTKLKDDLI
ncbi:hypothetical protein VMCG_08362 [Cytospora schulzeri]|uniref:DNA-directed RNA polymerase subunit n=1 Tax=Cytospora schulzeri TaxID=448051 RepID=A0A423VVB5_9PEZI|nr:hypothetical protein VMCG_08362 [Valsa malicola]